MVSFVCPPVQFQPCGLQFSLNVCNRTMATWFLCAKLQTGLPKKHSGKSKKNKYILYVYIYWLDSVCISKIPVLVRLI